ncbi:MAG: hypothetical protein ABID09_05030 [Candidatus Omnitrophota bacterium]
MKANIKIGYGALDESRLELTEGRDIALDYYKNREPLNYFIYPHVEIDGRVFEDVDVTFGFEETGDD